LGRKAPSPDKKKAVSEDQEGCGQTSQQTSPDWFEGEENAQENVWPQAPSGKEKKEKVPRQWNHSLHQLRKRRHIGPKSRESPPAGRWENK